MTIGMDGPITLCITGIGPLSLGEVFTTGVCIGILFPTTGEEVFSDGQLTPGNAGMLLAVVADVGPPGTPCREGLTGQ
jgi:hypothetical protein